jgi:hypothetical protein
MSWDIALRIPITVAYPSKTFFMKAVLSPTPRNRRNMLQLLFHHCVNALLEFADIGAIIWNQPFRFLAFTLWAGKYSWHLVLLTFWK